MIIKIKVREAKSWNEKIQGLIGREKTEPLLIKTRFGIHTFGLHYPIDVLVLDKYNFVVKMQRALKPNRLFFWNPLHDQIIELAEGMILKKKIKLGDKIETE